MAYFEEGSTAMLQLEAMVDKVGVRNVVWALAHICSAKAEHIQANWQDASLAKQWQHVSNVLANVPARLGDVS